MRRWDAGISAMLRHADDLYETVEASFLAACDGAHSAMRNRLRIAFGRFVLLRARTDSTSALIDALDAIACD
jgi:2-polyprenyl-6-methoxyphenol hydroxylase-like FAD-dependent oxidoreductase